MPSPFPGMDPYLENPARWTGVHNALIAKMAAQLNALLDPRYAVLQQERVYIAEFDDPGRRSMYPDLLLVEATPADEPRITVGNVSLLAVAQPVEVELTEIEMHDAFLEIIDVEDHHVITVIEILSPTNKSPGARGREEFLRKRKQVLSSSTNWVEIDLLREGERFTPVNFATQFDYAVQISRVAERRRYRIWPIQLPQQLPVIAIPLVNQEEQRFDLQQLLTSVYDESPYRRLIDYTRDPVPALPARYADWAHQLLKSQGLRK